MADKSLTESAWKAFAKDGAYKGKDGPLLKALAALAKAEKAGAQDQLDAVADVVREADALKKQFKADKKLGDYLSDVDDALKKQQKASEQALEAEKKAVAQGDDDEESPALLTTKLIPLLREVRKGDLVLQALIATVGKDTAVLLSRKSISPTRGKLLKDYLGATGAIKFIRGECLFEENMHTFVVQSKAAGLAKQLKAALLAQTDLRLKVRVRGEDPDDVEEEAEQDGDGGAAPSVKPVAGAPADSAPEPTPAPTPTPEQARFETRLADLEPVLARTLQAQGGDVSRLRAVAAFARDKADARDWAAGLKSLDMLEKLLDAANGSPDSAAAGGSAGADPAAAFNARLAALLPRVKDALTGGHPQAGDIKLKVSEAGVAARQKELERAGNLLDEAELLLGPPGTGDAPAVDSGKAFNARLAAMQGAIKAAMAGPLAAELKPLVAAIAAAKADLGAASNALDAIEALLSRPAAKPVVTEAAWQGRLDALQARYAEVLAGNPADATKLRATMGFATEQADRGDHARAVDVLTRLAKMLEEAAGNAGNTDGGLPAAGIVAYRSALLAFKGAYGTVQSQLQALKSAIPQQLPDEADLAGELEEELRAFNEELQDAVDAAMVAAQDDAAPVQQALADTLAAYQAELTNHALVQHVDRNPFGVKVAVGQLLGDALRKIINTMPATA